jgi:hypothetical protein
MEIWVLTIGAKNQVVSNIGRSHKFNKVVSHRCRKDSFYSYCNSPVGRAKQSLNVWISI